MTADPKAPGAEAVCLDVEQIANAPLHFQSLYKRIEVPTENGLELAIVNLPYLSGNFQIADLKGCIIEPDGAVIPFASKLNELLIAKSGDRQFERKVFTLDL